MTCDPGATPSVFDDIEALNSSPETRFSFPDPKLTSGCMTRSATTAPIAIPSAKQSRARSQRHTNFTPPRSYIGVVEPSMVRSKSVGSISTAVSLLVTEHMHPSQPQGDVQPLCVSDIPGSASGFTSEFTSKSVPNFERCVLEQGIGQELRVISDSFCLEFDGFRHGYGFVRCTGSTCVYPSSYPGCLPDSGISCRWQGVVTKISPGIRHKKTDGADDDDHDQQAITAASCEHIFPHQFD